MKPAEQSFMLSSVYCELAVVMKRGGPAQLACSMAAGAFAMLLYYNGGAPVRQTDRVNSHHLKESEKCVYSAH